MATISPKYFIVMAILILNIVILIVSPGYFQSYRSNRSFTRLLPHMDTASVPRIGKCTMIYNRDNAGYNQALRKHAQHCKRHGHAFHVLDHTILDDVWTKPAYILSILLAELEKPEDERLAWLMWVDADTVVMNPLIPLSLFLPPAEDEEFGDVNFLVTKDDNGLNNGVFIVRVSASSVELFSAIVSYRHYHPQEQLQFRDQTAMERILEEPKFARNTKFVPQYWFNAYRSATPENSNDDGKIRYGIPDSFCWCCRSSRGNGTVAEARGWRA